LKGNATTGNRVAAVTASFQDYKFEFQDIEQVALIFVATPPAGNHD
jgi:hypothetical protein